MAWCLLAIAGLLLPPTFAADGWLRIYLAVLAVVCAVAAMVAIRLKE